MSVQTDPEFMTVSNPGVSGRVRPRRIVRRHGERGAAVFVVVLVITLLASLGVFAVKASTISNRTSGYNRQLTQTHYMAELAFASTIADLQKSMNEAHLILHNRQPTTGQMQCEAMPFQLNSPCMFLSYEDLDLVTLAPLVEPAGVGSHGTLGAGDLVANAWLELTDPHRAPPPPGYQLGGGAADTQELQFEYVTVTVTGVVQPDPGGAGFNLESATAAGFERQRGHIIMGPVLAPK